MKEIIVADNGKNLDGCLEKAADENNGSLDLITRVRPKDRILIEYFNKINKNNACSCPVEFFVYPYNIIYAKSFHNIIPFDADVDTVVKVAHEIENTLKRYEAEYNKTGRTKLKYSMSIRLYR